MKEKFFSVILIIIVLSCASKKQELNSEWINLSDDNSFNNWHTYLSDSVIGWKIEDGAYVYYPGERNSNNGLVSNKSYTSFILSLEWKVEKNGNSGIFWGVNESREYSVPYLSAAEIQVLDDDIYGKEDTGRYVCESRLKKMLSQEYGLIETRLDREQYPDTDVQWFYDEPGEEIAGYL